MSYQLPPDSAWVADNVTYGLPQAAREQNAALIADYFSSVHDWTLTAIAGLLGNADMESTINPGIWQNLKPPGSDWASRGGGFGLTQWTPGRVYLNWAGGGNYQYGGWSRQLECWGEEYLHNPYDLNMWLKWNHTPSGGVPLSMFQISYRQYAEAYDPSTGESGDEDGLSPHYAGIIFWLNYGRPSPKNATAERGTARGNSAQRWYTWLRQHPPQGHLKDWLFYVIAKGSVNRNALTY